jgi:hypothetical protein
MLRIQSITPSANGLSNFPIHLLPHMKQMIFNSHDQNVIFEVVVYRRRVYVLGYLCLAMGSEPLVSFYWSPKPAHSQDTS